MTLSTDPAKIFPGESTGRQALLFGHDDTPGIVSVMADRSGRARVWRRVDGTVLAEEDAFPCWFFLARRELLGDLPVQNLDASILESTPRLDPGTVGLVRLRGNNPFGYLVLTDRLADLERRVGEATRRAHEAGSLSEPLSELIYVRPSIEQYLTITGRTYFKGMTYRDVRRLQFDLETTSLDSASGVIFMVAIKDSDGFSAVLDTTSMSEAELIAELVRIIRERDPDVIENHNIFDFDIRFLTRRAQLLGVPLPLGRDGSTFSESRDSVKVGGNNESFTRYSLAGREIIDTLHATKRFSAIQRDLRSNGLKEAARYFGVARPDRVYIEGVEVWPTFQRDPERVRRYCLDDVEEVDRLSAVLLAPSFALASMVPKSYERIATAGTGQGLIEPLLVRAYACGGYSLPLGKSSGTFAGGRTGVFTTGVIENVVKADVASLYPSIMLSDRIKPATDAAGAFLTLLEELTASRLQHKAAARRWPAGRAADRVAQAWQSPQPEGPVGANNERVYHESMQAAMKVLINSFYGMLGASFALFCDRAAAERVTARGREILQMVLDALQARGATLIEADTDGVLFSLPGRADGQAGLAPQGGAATPLPPLGSGPRPNAWTYDEEVAFIEEIGAALPVGVHLEHDGRYRAMYSYMEKNYALLDYDSEDAAPASLSQGQGTRAIGEAAANPLAAGPARLRLVGSAFRSAKAEPLIEHFLGGALRALLAGEIPRVRDLYRSACAALRGGQVPVQDVCVTMPLSKEPKKYAQTQRKEEPYEVWLAAGNTDWRAGTRIRYYQARSGKRLFAPGVSDYDPDFYINRLRTTCLQRLEKALARDDLEVIFSESGGLFDPPIEGIRTLCATFSAPIGGEEDAKMAGEAGSG